MTAHAYRWPDEHVHWQGVIAAAPDYSVPFAVHVFILKTRLHLRAAVGHEHASAFSITPEEADHAGVGATMLFNLEDIELSLAAHEATHVALSHHSNIETTRIGAKRWLWDHPESVAEMTGNLTALVWAKLYEHGARVSNYPCPECTAEYQSPHAARKERVT